MNAESLIFSLLTGNATIMGLVGNRLYPVQAPQDPTYSFLIYYRDKTESFAGLDGIIGLQKVYLVIESHCKGAGVCANLRNQIRKLLDRNGNIRLQNDLQQEIPDKIGYFVGVQVYEVTQANSD